jgi:protease I
MNRPHDPASATNAALARAQAFMTPSPVPSISTELLVTADGGLNREFHKFLSGPPSNPDLLKGKKIAICCSNVVEEPCVVDGNLITARFPHDLPRLVEQLVKQLVK